jgi:hypothetical protein
VAYCCSSDAYGILATFKWVLRGFGIQFGGEGHTSSFHLPITESLRACGQWLIVPKNILALSVCAVALAISYYFSFALPASNRERLQFEKERADATKSERDKREETAKQVTDERKQSFQNCELEADTSYWQYVKLNGKAVVGKLGVYNAPMFVWNLAEKNKINALAECHRQFDK